VDIAKKFNHAHIWLHCRNQSRKQVDLFLREHKFSVYRRLYVHRAEEEKTFLAFLEASQHAFPLVGGAGMGKSFLLCYLCQNYFQNGHLVLFLEGGFNLRKPEDLMNEIESIVPESVSVDPRGMYKLLNDIASERDKFFIIFADALNEADEYQQTEILRAINDFVYILARLDASKIKLVLSCRTQRWRQLLQSVHMLRNSFFKMREQQEYGVIIGDFDQQEMQEAARRYFQQQASALPDAFQEMCRDPLLLDIAWQMYAGKNLDEMDLPETPLKLLEAYFNHAVSDKVPPELTIINIEKRGLIFRLLDYMRSKGLRQLNMQDCRDDELISFIREDGKNNIFIELIDKRILHFFDNQRVHLPDRIAEYFYAQRLKHESEITADTICEIIQRDAGFPFLIGGLRHLIEMEQLWKDDLCLKLAASEHYAAFQLLIEMLTQRAAMEPEHTQTLLEALMSSNQENIRQKAIHAAYYVYETLIRERSNVEIVRAKAEEILIRGAFDNAEEVRAATRHCIYYLATKSADEGISILDGIQKKMTFRSLRSLQYAFETIMVVSILICSDRYGEEQIIRQLGRCVRGCGAKIGLAGRGLLRKPWQRVLTGGAQFMVNTIDYEEYAHINREEVDEFFKSKDFRRRTMKPMWLHLLEYAKLEKPFGEETSSGLSWETIKEEIITLGNQDILSFVLLALTFPAQVAAYGNEDIVLSLIEQIGKRGKEIGCGFGYGFRTWLLGNVRYALGAKTVSDDIRRRVEAIAKDIIERTYEGYPSKIGLRYKTYCIGEFASHELQWTDAPTSQFLNKWLIRATESRDAKMLVSLIENLKALAVYFHRHCGHALAAFKQVIDEVMPHIPTEEGRKEISEALVNALGVIHVYYPDAIEGFINSLQNKMTPEAMTKIRGSKISEGLNQLIGARLYFLLNKIMIGESGERRNQIIDGLASAVLCGSSKEFAVQIVRHIVNGVAGTNFKVKRLKASEHGFGQKLKKLFGKH